MSNAMSDRDRGFGYQLRWFHLSTILWISHILLAQQINSCYGEILAMTSSGHSVNFNGYGLGASYRIRGRRTLKKDEQEKVIKDKAQNKPGDVKKTEADGKPANKGKITMEPTPAPSPMPTPMPTSMPTTSPTSNPTPFPTKKTTLSPSSEITSIPSIDSTTNAPTRVKVDTDFGSEDYKEEPETSLPTITSTPPPTAKLAISVKFSVLMSEQDQEIDAARLSSSEDDGLVLNLLQATTMSICTHTDYQIIATNNPNRNLCDIFRSRRQLKNQNHYPFFSDQLSSTRSLNPLPQKRLAQSKQNEIFAVLSIDPFASISSVQEHSLLNNTYMEVTLRCGIEEVGEWYTQMSEMSFGLVTPDLMIESAVQDVIDESISDGSFFDYLKRQESENEAKTRSVAVVGKEDSTFIPIIHNLFDNSNASQKLEEYIVTPMHSTRLSGIIMLLFTIIVTVTLFRAGSRRQKETIWKEKTENQDNGGKIHLSSEDGVNAMLKKGSSKVVLKRGINVEDIDDQDDDATRSLSPSPRWQVMIGSANTSPLKFEHVYIS